MPGPSSVLYLAVLPGYRRECIDLLISTLPDVEIYVSPAHLDPTVRTGLPSEQFTAVRMHRFAGRAFLQTGYWRRAIAARTLVVDMNPRSLTAWILLAVRRILFRRTLVWGHLHSQAGERSKTRHLRIAMRRLAAGTVTYTYENLSSAQKEIQDQPVWVAPNSLYRREEIFFSDDTQERKSIVYVGRFEPAKKVHLLVRGFHKSRLFENGVRLVLVGDGSQREALENEVANLGLREHVEFRGWRTDVAEIRETYADAFTSVSPGFIGLGLTQSLGFGVPMVAALDEPHSPEVELAKTGGVSWFPTDDEAGLGEALQRAWGRRSHVPDATLQSTVKSRYSAEAMAEGLVSALLNRRVVSVDPKIQREGATNNDQ